MSWKESIDEKVSVLISHVGYLRNELVASNTDPELIKELCQPFLETLEQIYREEYPLAAALEESDLVIKIEGPGVDKHNPRVSLVEAYFGKVRKEVTALAKAIAHFGDNVRAVPREFDLNLSAFARGSVVLGFTLPTAEDMEAEGQATLFGKNDPFYLAAREALRTLGVVSHFAAQNATLAEIAEAVPDAKVRDVALTAVNSLAPSGRGGVSRVVLGGKEIGDMSDVVLTKEIRANVRKDLLNPVISKEQSTLHGYVREIDLDAKRFDLRHIENNEINEVRCIYKDFSDNEATGWLNRPVTVEGAVDRDPSGKARLLAVTSIKVG